MYNIEIDKLEVARYLGFAGKEADSQTKNDIQSAIELLGEKLEMKTHYAIFDIDKSQNITLEKTNLSFGGESAKDLLEDCNKCILLIATLGSGVDELIRKLQITNMPLAVVADFCASSLVENLCNQFEDEIKKNILKSGEFFTDRFSPGYGDMPLSIQKQFCEVLDASKRVGVFVNSGGIMIPRKTITAVIGIANRPQKAKIKGCAFCDLKETCEYRKGGKRCV